MSVSTGSRGLKVIALLLIMSAVVTLSLLMPVRVLPSEGEVAPAENRSMRLATDAQDLPWAVWESDDGKDTDIYYSRWNGSGWQPARPLSANPEFWEHSPSLAFAADGTLWAAWSRGIGPGQTDIWVSHWLGNKWSSPAQVPGTVALAGRQPVLAPTPEGGLWLAWVGHDGTDKEIFVSRWADNAWSAPQQVGSDDTDPLAYDMHPTLVVDNAGSAWLAWTSYEGSLNDEIHASHWDGTTWSAQQQVSRSDDTPDAWPSMVLDAEGQPWIAWHGVSAEDATRWRVFFSQWDPAESTWSAEALVSLASERDIDERYPDLALDAEGRLHLAWTVSGELSGLALTTWDGTDWASPTWARADESVDSPAVLAGEEPRLFWLGKDGPPLSPVREQQLQEMTEPLAQVQPSTAEPLRPLSTAIANLHLAHGDSITLGDYTEPSGEPVVPYPKVLEELLDSYVAPSIVVNWGKNAEKARNAGLRLTTGVQLYTPQFVEILEGTNDISADMSPAEAVLQIRELVWRVRDSGVVGVQTIVGTLIPRNDNHYEEIEEANQMILDLIPRKDKVPVADLWQAYLDYGSWQSLLADGRVHPNTAGLQIIAETFYQRMLEVGMITEDRTPPTAWITAQPAQSECRAAVSLAWTGDDGNGTGITSFDVQVKEGSAAWSDWLVGTSSTSGTYANAINAPFGQTLSFRVRARDLLNNLGAYSQETTTSIIDSIPPNTVAVAPLAPARIAPFTVRWWGTDTCDPQVTFNVKYCIGAACTGPGGTWLAWQTSTTNTSALFQPTVPQYGARYYFRATARDDAGNSTDSALVSTLLARYTLGGHVRTVRDQPVAVADVDVTGSLFVEPFGVGGYRAYIAGAGTYDLTASRTGFGSLPPRYAFAVSDDDVTGLDFVLPPLDDIVRDGGFESGTWGAWQPVGAVELTPMTEAHTGVGAVRLGGDGGASSLSQSLTVPDTLTDPTLSFLVKLGDTTGTNSVQIQLEGTSLSWDEPVSPGAWVHIWHEIDQAVGQPVTLAFSVSGSPAVVIDEVSLGSAASGGSWSFFPVALGGKR